MTRRGTEQDVSSAGPFSPPGRYVVSLFDVGLWRRNVLRPFLDAPVVAYWGIRQTAVIHIGWGMKPSGLRARARAQAHGAPCLLLEDGFLRSVTPGALSMSCSLVADDLGIYYDASTPSRLEAMVLTPLTATERTRAQHLIRQWRAANVSKYNYAPDAAVRTAGDYVLVVDQTANDASVKCGEANAGSFQRMLEAALERYPDCRVLVKEHPEVSLGHKRGYLSQILDAESNPRVERLAEDAHVVSLIRQARAVFVVTSQVGFEALIHGVPVHTFGMPFYAGWGLTIDHLPPPDRRGSVSLEQLVFAALVRYARYVLPLSGKRCEVEDVIEHLALQRRMHHALPNHLHAVGFSRWKRPILKNFLQGHQVTFHRTLANVPGGGTVLCWGRQRQAAQRADLSLITVEDGFLRSVGLGAQLVRPISWVFDRSGIYYDATSKSDLERLLASSDFDAVMIERAERLRQSIVSAGITKYNVGVGSWMRPPIEVDVVLVVGQVETDASLRYGAPGICTNRELLEAVRADEPDAYILYKPHPDVMTGLRGDREAEKALASLCDELVPDYPMDQLIDSVDRVHVLTSLAGFEALLRGKPVTTHGAPFYAGWGLTDDRCILPRRTRLLSLDMLVAGALILYPRYVIPSNRRGFATPEQAVAHIVSWRKERIKQARDYFRGWIKPLLRRWIHWRDAAAVGKQGAGDRESVQRRHHDCGVLHRTGQLPDRPVKPRQRQRESNAA
ncbi:capsular polysaccharide biosynthesis protein [Cupriavidus alkaliphilus]|uniref:capsular polysaccharide biosynthesis protein n=1 Tax=Cupriavidus alkaliphilus TaxID=942866 RepID=UPI001608F8F5|nr:capsular polysaccharide biosynthesis protein [Cupriavidus alkaliphilus]MBB3015427.1 capsular polysaccharide export protein [Cupriavidus alkaliphilus]